MFNFLNPTILIAAVAALIPLIIHLFSKRRVKIVEFSSLKHLKAMQKRQVRRLKIRQLLLLILRMLILLAVVLAFARPTLQNGGIGSHASVSAVVLFDNSASMNREVSDGNLFDLSQKRALQILDNFGETDQVCIIPLDQSENRINPKLSSAAVAKDQLSKITRGSGIAELQKGLEQANDLLKKASNLNKELYIISDQQRVSLPDSTVLKDSDAKIYLVEIPTEEYDNCGITNVDFGGQLILAGHDFTTTATIKNQSQRDRSDIIASLFVDGHRVSQVDLEVSAGNETSVNFTHSVSRGGFHDGYIELSDDQFQADNKYYFSFKIPQQFNVLIIKGDNAAGLISLAMVPSQSINQYWSVKEVELDELAGINFIDYDVVILSGTPPLEEGYVRRLKSFVTQGKSLFLTFGGTTDIDDFNTNWSEIAGLVFDEGIKRDFTKAGYYTIDKVDITHPIFSVFNFETEKFPELKFYTLPKMHTKEESKVLASFSGKRPALVERKSGSGRILTFTGSIAPQFSDLTGHAFFVPFISRISEYLATDLSSYDVHLFAEENISRTIAVNLQMSASVEMIAPDSQYYYLSPEEENGNLILKPQPTNLPGIYNVRYLGREIDRFALNVNPDECNLAGVIDEQFADAIGADDYRLVQQNTNAASIISEFRFGKELWQIFLWIAVLFIIAEMLLSKGVGKGDS